MNFCPGTPGKPCGKRIMNKSKMCQSCSARTRMAKANKKTYTEEEIKKSINKISKECELNDKMDWQDEKKVDYTNLYWINRIKKELLGDL